jgi:hypothetical protein
MYSGDVVLLLQFLFVHFLDILFKLVLTVRSGNLVEGNPGSISGDETVNLSYFPLLFYDILIIPTGFQ